MTPAATPFVISRTFDAPRDLVWRAWTEADVFAEWWGNRGFTVELAWFDPRPGGQTRYAMRPPSGDAMHGKFVYREVSAPDHLVFVSGFADADGEFAPAPFDGPWPLRIETAVTLEPVEGGTRLTLIGGPIDASEAEIAAYDAMHGTMRSGFGGTFDRLEELLANERLAR